MAENEDQDRGVLGRLAHKIKDAFSDPDLERGLENQAAAMPAAGGDLSMAGGESPAGMTPGSGAAAAGSLTDGTPVGRAGEKDDLTEP